MYRALPEEEGIALWKGPDEKGGARQGGSFHRAMPDDEKLLPDVNCGKKI